MHTHAHTFKHKVPGNLLESSTGDKMKGRQNEGATRTGDRIKGQQNEGVIE